MSYLGDILLGDTLDFKFTSRAYDTHEPFTLAGTPAISAYVGNSVTQITAGITLTVDFDSVVGLNNVRVVASAANGYAAGTNVALVITTGTIDSVSAVGEVVGSFSIQARTDRIGVYKVGAATSDGGSVNVIDTGNTEDTSTYFRNARVVALDGAAAGMSRHVASFLPASDNIGLDSSWPAGVTLDTGDRYAIMNDGGVDVKMWSGIAVSLPVTGRIPVVSAVVDTSGNPLTGTADSGSTTQMVDAARIGAGNDFWNGCGVLFTSGSLAGLEREILDYVSASGTFELGPALPAAVSTHTYVLTNRGMVDANVKYWRSSEVTEDLMDDAGVKTAIGLTDDLDDRTLSPAAATALETMFANVITVDDATFSPTTTAFETDRTVDDAVLYGEQVLYGLTGDNAKLTVRITGYAFTNSKVKLTVDALSAAPADGDTFLLLGRIEQ